MFRATAVLVATFGMSRFVGEVSAALRVPFVAPGRTKPAATNHLPLNRSHARKSDEKSAELASASRVMTVYRSRSSRSDLSIWPAVILEDSAGHENVLAGKDAAKRLNRGAS
jgi:hypothetical protein